MSRTLGATIPTAAGLVGSPFGGGSLTPRPVEPVAAPSANPLTALLRQQTAPQRPGLLGKNFDDPRTQAVLAAAGSLLNAGGYSPMPTTFGQNVGQALQTYSQTLQQQKALAAAQRQKNIENQINLMKALKPAKARESQVRIDNLVARGIPRETAEAIVYKAFKVFADPVSGEPTVVDLTKIGDPNKTAAPPESPEAQPQAATLFSDVEAAQNSFDNPATGLKAKFDQIAESTVGQVLPWDFQGERSRSIRNKLKLSSQRLKRLLAVNSRFPVYEQKVIQEELGIEPSMFQTHTQLLGRMMDVKSFLEQRLSEAIKISKDKTQGVNRRRAALEMIPEFEGYLKILGSPGDSASGSPTVTIKINPDGTYTVQK